jgi:hypothetical protein
MDRGGREAPLPTSASSCGLTLDEVLLVSAAPDPLAAIQVEDHFGRPVMTVAVEWRAAKSA